MISVNTKLDEQVFEQIISSKITPYKFLQEAVKEKLSSDAKQKEFENLMFDIVSAVNSRLEGFEKELAISNTIAREKLSIIAEKLNGN